MKKVCVILLNMGGPSRSEEVKPFLTAMFRDPDLIRFPLKNLLAPLIIRMRTKVAEKRYGQVEGGSPLLRITLAQAEALQDKLNKGNLADFKVITGMRYTQPTIGDAVKTALEWNCDEIIGLSMYPQFCKATIGSSILELKRAVSKEFPVPTVKIIDRYYDHPGYIDAFMKIFRENVENTNLRPYVLFSAHGVPVSMVREGDPYVRETEATVNALAKGLGLPENTWSLSYQSRMGPVRWVGPATETTIEHLGKRGVDHLVIVPVSFAVDNLETLYDIGIVFAQKAKKVGIKKVQRTPSLNVHPKYIDTLRSLVEQATTSAPSAL